MWDTGVLPSIDFPRYSMPNMLSIDPGIPSTILTAIVTIVLAVLSKSSGYILGPLWLAPLFILRSARSDVLAGAIFDRCKFLFNPEAVIDIWIKGVKAVYAVLLVISTIYVGIYYFFHKGLPPGWVSLALLVGGLIIAGGICAGVLTAALGTASLIVYSLSLVLVTAGCRAIGIAATTLKSPWVTLRAMRVNYEKAIRHDTLRGVKPELAPKASALGDEYTGEEFLERTNNAVDKLHEKLEKHAGDKGQIFVAILCLVFYLGCWLALWVPSVLPRLSIKASVWAIGIILLVPGDVTSRERGARYVVDIARNWKAPATAILLLCLQMSVALLALFQGRALLPQHPGLDQTIRMMAELIATGLKGALFISSVVITVASYVIARRTLRRWPSRRQRKIAERRLRLIGWIRVAGITSFVLSILGSDVAVEFLVRQFGGR